MSKQEETEPPAVQEPTTDPAPATPAPGEGDVISPADEGDDPPIKK